MSRGSKVTYGGSAPTVDLNCIDDKQYLGDILNHLLSFTYEISGGGFIPSDASTEPESNPARRLVRFKTTEAMGATTSNQAAAIAVDGARADLASPTITVHDTLQRYSSAGSGKYGWAMYTEYPDDTYILEIVSLGGEGTVTGTANDEKVKVNASDSTEQYLEDKLENTGGTYNSSTHQLVYFEQVDTSGVYSLRAYTSKVSTTLDYTVKVNASDTTSQYLQACFHSDNTAVAAYDVDDHSIVQVEVVTDAPSAGERQLRLFVDKTLETGKVKTSNVDTLAYLEDQFTDDLAYDSTKHQLVYNDTTGAPRSSVRHFTETALCAKITGTIPERVGDGYGIGSAAIGYTASGSWTQISASETVYNPGASSIHVPSNLTAIHMPVVKCNGEWILVNPFDPYQLEGLVYANDQSIGRDASSEPEWQDDGACDA